MPQNLNIETLQGNFKKGLDLQRERYKSAKNGIGYNNFDLMADSIENIKSEIKSKLIAKNKAKVVLRVESIILWYRTLERQYLRNTPDGKRVIYPTNISERINQNLTTAYELLIKELDILGLL